MEEAEGLGLGVDFVSGHGNFEGLLSVIHTFVHDSDGANGNEAENADCEHDFD